MTDYMNQYRRNLRALNKSSRTKPRPGEIWWAEMLDGIKDRPVLVLGCDGSNVTFRKCTTKSGNCVQRDLIEEPFDAGLDQMTYVDPEMRTISRKGLVRKMGELSDTDLTKFGLQTS